MLPSFTVPEGDDTESYFRHVAREGLERRFARARRAAGEEGRRARPTASASRSELDVIVEDEVPGLLPHRLGLHPLREGERRSPSARAAARAPGRSSRTRCGSPTSIPSRTTCSSSASSTPSACSMPDFDVDFCMDRRDRSSRTSARSTARRASGRSRRSRSSRRKSVIKDVARAWASRRSRRSRSRTSSREDARRDVHDRRGLEVEPKLKALCETRAADRASCSRRPMKLEGLTRHAGKHAAGIVISEGPLWDHVPVFKNGDGASSRSTTRTTSSRPASSSSTSSASRRSR